MLRNFRKDGHNWKKKKDGKTVKEAHEHLKVSMSCFIGHYFIIEKLVETSDLFSFFTYTFF